jgi:hypothetical protein
MRASDTWDRYAWAAAHFVIPLASDREWTRRKIGTRKKWQAARDDLAKLEAEQRSA